MKFLIMSSPKDIIFTQPPSAVMKMTEENQAWIDQKEKEGVILESYSIAGWNRYAMICQLGSAEEIDRFMRAMPATAFMNYETYPLSDWKETAKANVEAAKAAQARAG